MISKVKKVAVAPSTPSQTLLLFMLEAANLKTTDIQMVEVPTTADAETAFKSGKVDAAVVWDAQASLREVPGSKVLQSTVTAIQYHSRCIYGQEGMGQRQ
jgi:sulfonate transport system substrate-binding protein